MNEEKMLKGKISGFAQKNSRHALFNSHNNERALSAKAQNTILDLEKTKEKLETYEQDSNNINKLMVDTVKELMNEPIVLLKEKHEQANVLSNVVNTKSEILAKNKELVKLTAHKVKNVTIRNFRNNNHIELDKIILAEKDPQRKIALHHIQARLLPAVGTLQQQEEPKVSTKPKAQLVGLKN